MWLRCDNLTSSAMLQYLGEWSEEWRTVAKSDSGGENNNGVGSMREFVVCGDVKALWCGQQRDGSVHTPYTPYTPYTPCTTVHHRVLPNTPSLFLLPVRPPFPQSHRRSSDRRLDPNTPACMPSAIRRAPLTPNLLPPMNRVVRLLDSRRSRDTARAPSSPRPA